MLWMLGLEAEENGDEGTYFFLVGKGRLVERQAYLSSVNLF